MREDDHIALCRIDRWGEIIEEVEADDHDLRDLAGQGQDIYTQNLKLEDRTVARVAIQYSPSCFSQKAIEHVTEKASTALGKYLAKRLNREQKDGGN